MAYLPKVKIQDGAGNDLTSQANGSQRALDVGINVGGVQIDPRSLTASSAVIGQVGRVFSFRSIFAQDKL